MRKSGFLLAIVSLLFSFSAEAGTCDERASARVEAANRLIVEAREAAAIDQASILERAQILLERTLEDSPSCDRARTLIDLTESLKPEFQSNSAAAATEVILVRADDTLVIMERDGVSNPAILETLRFQLAALSQELGEDARLTALSERAAALAVVQ